MHVDEADVRRSYKKKQYIRAKLEGVGDLHRPQQDALNNYKISEIVLSGVTWGKLLTFYG